MKHASPRDLQAFIAILKKEREIIEVDAEVNPYLEIAEVHRRVIEQGGPAILFNRVKGSTFPVVTNLFGTEKRVNLAFGTRPERFIEELAELPTKLTEHPLSLLWKKRSLLKDLLHLGLNKNSRAYVTEVQQSPPRLTELPLLTTWPDDGGAFITLPLVYTEHPETRAHNLGMYRIHRYDDATTGLHCQIGKGGGFHLAVARDLGIKLPVNIFVGGPPALILSAIAPLPENVPELLLTSLVMGAKLGLTRDPHSALPLVANAEFALVGEVDPNEQRPEGPFGDHYGYYSLQHLYPVFHCKRVYHRKNAIYPATVVGKPKQEDFFLGDYLQRLLRPLIKVAMPTVTDLWSYGDTGYHSLAAASVRERYPREGLVSAFRILGEGQLSLTKFLLLVKPGVELSKFRLLLEHVLERADFSQDLYLFGHTSMDSLDYAGPKINRGSKGVLMGCGDVIRSLPGEFSRQLPPNLKEVREFCRGCLVVTGQSFSENPSLGKELADIDAFKEWPLIVLADDAKAAVVSESSFLWMTFTRFDPARDIFAAGTSLKGNHIEYTAPIVIDARMKPWYPPVVTPADDTVKLVDKRWNEYFPNRLK